MTSPSVIETHALSKSYGSVEAVRGVNLSVKAQHITAFLGLNGAGKSTTIKMLLGMIRPSGGSGQVLGKSIDDANDSVHLRGQVAYVSENKQLYGYMTVEQMIRFTRSFYSDWRVDIERRLLSTYELPLNRKVDSLSKGMRTKLALLLAFARQPKLLILDEPSEGLDPLGIEQMLESLVAQCSEGTTIFFRRTRYQRRNASPTRFASSIEAAWSWTLRSMTSVSRIDSWNLCFPLLPRNRPFAWPEWRVYGRWDGR